MICHDGRVKDEDRVSVIRVWLVVVDYLSSGMSQQTHQGVMLLSGYLQVRSVGIMPHQGVGDGESFIWSPLSRPEARITLRWAIKVFLMRRNIS